jgi:hypothetical protein
MELKKFEMALKNNNAIMISDDILLFNDLELYNLKNDTSIYFKDYEKMYDYELSGKTIKNIVLETKEFTINLAGGRGAGSSNNGMGGGFTSARGGRRGYGKMLYPAQMNALTGGRYKSYEKTLQTFVNKYKKADREYGLTVDEQGYTHRYARGGKSSVSISGGKGEMIVHNHPSGGNFSKQDLVSVASGKEKGIVAVGKRNYTFKKKNSFKAKEFIKAVNKAKWPKKYSYDKGSDWWLRKNAKQYGYTYTNTSNRNKSK